MEAFILPLDIMPFNDKSAYYYAHIRALLAQKGMLIGVLDRMIAAHAQSLDATLITNNVGEFSQVSNLKIENWVQSL